MTDRASAILHATLEAARLHRDLGLQAKAERGSGRIDVYEAISRLDVALMFTHLEGLLGAYYREPSPGILVTTQRPLNQQRFTAAHELGHHYLGHTPSLDDDSILRRVPFNARSTEAIQEIEAEAFGAAFLLPQWLMDWHCDRQGWSDDDLLDPTNVYQLALRVGTSFTAAVWTLHRYKVFDLAAARALAAVDLRDTKKHILKGYSPQNYKRDVWSVGPHDDGAPLVGGPGDLFVLNLEEHSSSGYLWTIKSIADDQMAIVADSREGEDGAVGGVATRKITASSMTEHSGKLLLQEARPWQPSAPLNELTLTYDANGSHRQGWYEQQRVRHRRKLEAV